MIHCKKYYNFVAEAITHLPTFEAEWSRQVQCVK